MAPNGKVALKIVSRSVPDLILLDNMMPGIDGFETCRRLKKNEATQSVPVIFISAKIETEEIVKGFSLSGVDYITKPFRQEEVLPRVKLGKTRDLQPDIIFPTYLGGGYPPEITKEVSC